MKTAPVKYPSWDNKGEQPDPGMLVSRQVGERAWLFLEWYECDHLCGSSLALVDLTDMPQDTIAKALECCGVDFADPDAWIHRIENRDRALAECCASYGAKAPLWESGLMRSEKKAWREGLAEGNRLVREGFDLERSVNKIGTTAREFMHGDFLAGMARSVEAGRSEARLLAKCYGIPQEVIDEARPADWLPYMCGYHDGMSGRDERTAKVCCSECGGDGEIPDPMSLFGPDIACTVCAGTGEVPSEEEISPEYGRGHERALRVLKGECPAPSWLVGQEKPHA